MHRLSNTRPNVFRSPIRSPGPAPSAAVAMDGSTKCHVGEVRTSSLARRLGFHAPRSSITNSPLRATTCSRNEALPNDSPQLCDVAQHRLVAALRGGHPGVRAHEHTHSFGVAPHAIHPRDVGLNDGVHVVRGLLQGKLLGLADCLGPTSTTREELDVPQDQPAPCDGDWPAVKQGAERDPSAGLPRLKQEHRAHAHPANPPDARVVGLAQVGGTLDQVSMN